MSPNSGASEGLGLFTVGESYNKSIHRLHRLVCKNLCNLWMDLPKQRVKAIIQRDYWQNSKLWSPVCEIKDKKQSKF